MESEELAVAITREEGPGYPEAFHALVTKAANPLASLVSWPYACRSPRTLEHHLVGAWGFWEYSPTEGEHLVGLVKALRLQGGGRGHWGWHITLVACLPGRSRTFRSNLQKLVEQEEAAGKEWMATFTYVRPASWHTLLSGLFVPYNLDAASGEWLALEREKE